MPFSQLLAQPFYNMLIEPLDEIEEQINKNSYQEALENVINMTIKLDETGWQPFPIYQSLLTKLQVKVYVKILFRILVDLKQNINIEKNKNNSLDYISSLKAFSHILNMLDVAFNDTNQTKYKIIYNMGKALGFFNEKPTQTYDCSFNLQYTNKNDQLTTGVPATKTYFDLVNCINNVTDLQLRNLSRVIFSTMDEVEKHDNIAELAKGEEKNYLILGHIERMINLSNLYKEQFRILREELNKPQNEDGEGFEDVYDLLHSLHEKKFF